MISNLFVLKYKNETRGYLYEDHNPVDSIFVDFYVPPKLNK